MQIFDSIFDVGLVVRSRFCKSAEKGYVQDQNISVDSETGVELSKEEVQLFAAKHE